LILRVTAGGQIEITDAEIVLQTGVALQLKARGVCFSKNVFDAGVEV